MNSRASFIDHRCGTRFSLAQLVEVESPGGLQGRGILENVSLSGAYLATPLPVVPLVQLSVRVLGSPHAVQAYVARVDDRGIGIEWLAQDPARVSSLMDRVTVGA